MAKFLCSRKHLIENLLNLVRIPSLSGSEEAIASEVSRQLEALGLTPKTDSHFNVQAEMGSGKTLLLNAHLDTVPPGKGWSFNPYKGKLVGGRIYGLGASDNKSGAAAMLEIARVLSRKDLEGKVVFLFTSQEESGDTRARKEVMKRLKADAGVCLDTCLRQPQGAAEIVVGCRSIQNFTLQVLGKAYHSSEPSLGVNAIYRAVDFIEAFQKLRYPSIKKPAEASSVASVTTMNTDGWPTRIPDLCELTVNYRGLPGEEMEKIQAKIRRLAEKTLEKDFRLKLRHRRKGYLLSLREPIYKAAEKALAEMGLRSTPVVSKGWIDAADFYNRAAVPIIGLGTTTHGQAHVKDEYEEVENLHQGAEAVLRTVLTYFKT